MKFVKQIFYQFSRDKCPTLAAALSYYTAFALPPLLFLLVTILSLGMSAFYSSEQAEERAQAAVEKQAAQMIGNESISDEIGAILEHRKESSGAWWKSTLSFLGILVGATGVVAALQASLNAVWEVKPDPKESGILDLLWKRVFSLGMILGLAFVLIVSLAVSTVLTGVGDQVGSMIGMSGIAAELVNYSVQAVVVFIVFGAIFKFMPDAHVRWSDVAVGAAATTALFLVGRGLMQVYFQYSNPGEQFGVAAASLAVLLVWVYYTAMIVLIGAEATQVYASMYGHGIRPESHAVRVTEKLQRTN